MKVIKKNLKYEEMPEFERINDHNQTDNIYLHFATIIETNYEVLVSMRPTD